jgi:hypothetical protein
MSKRLKVDLVNNKLIFNKDNMLLQIDGKLDINSFFEFVMDIFVKFIIVKYDIKREKNKKVVDKIKALVSLN